MRNSEIIFVLLIAFVYCVVPCSAVTIEVTPDTITDNAQIIVVIQDLGDGAEFSLMIEGEFATRGGDDFSFSVNEFEMPFSLNAGVVSAYTENTYITGFSANKNGQTISIAGPSDEHGMFSFSDSQNVSAGTYESISFEGTALETADTITTRFQIEGIKQGPTDAQISFTPQGIMSGTLGISIVVDGSNYLDKVLYTESEGGGEEDPDPVPEYTPGGSSAPSSGGTSSSEPAAQNEADSMHITRSDDGKAVVVSEEEQNLRLQKIDPEHVPEGWECLEGPYALIPEAITFDEQVVFSLNLSEEIRRDFASSTLFIAAYDGDKWSILPSQIETGAIQAHIGESGTFALMRFQQNDPAEVPPENAGTASAPQQATLPPQTTPPASGVPLVVSLFTAMCGCFMMVKYRRK